MKYLQIITCPKIFNYSIEIFSKEITCMEQSLGLKVDCCEFFSSLNIFGDILQLEGQHQTTAARPVSTSTITDNHGDN